VARQMAQFVADAWEHTLRVSPAPDNGFLFERLGGGPRKTYREQLTERKRNWYGELIPQIEIVKTNIQRLKGFRAHY
jgi:hypothetical protein